MKKLVTAALLLFLVGCASDQEKEAFNTIGDYYGAKVSYTKGFSANVGEKDHKYISLKITGSPYLDIEQPKKIAAYAAVLLYINLSDEEVNKYTDIEVRLFKNETEKVPVYERTYSLETVKNIASKSENFQKAGELLENGSPVEIYNLLNEKNKMPEQKDRFVSIVEKMKTTRSGVKWVKLLGVELLINNDTKERFLSYSGQIAWGNDTITSMSVRTSEEPNTNGLTSIDIK